ITAQVPRAMIGTDAFQEVDTMGMSMPITKHNFMVQDTAKLLEVIPRAFRIALSGRPGPVLVDIPKDVLSASIEVSAWPEPGRADPPPKLREKSLTRAAEMIAAAKRPVLYLGGGVVHSGAAAQAAMFAEKLSLP